MNRGDVILVRSPHASGLREKKRPDVVVQSDAYTGAVNTLVVAEITMRGLRKAELVEGEVYMPSPVRQRAAQPPAYLAGYLVGSTKPTP